MKQSGFAFSRTFKARFGILLFVLAALLVPSALRAQDDYQDPPSRVARLSYIGGNVSFQPAGTDDWIQATWNRPVTTGDQLWSDSGARAALHIGSASIVLSENTGFSFLNLTDGIAQMQLTSGSVRIRVKRLGTDEDFEVDTPNLAFSILQPGIYTISVDPSGQTTVIEDRAGVGQVIGAGASYNVNQGELDTFSGTDQLYAQTDSIYDSNDNDFEMWCEQRDHHEDNSISMRYVSDDVIGYDDLDDNGGWRQDPQYGAVWFPHTTIVGWAPYHYGHWAYIAPWGYTWVDDAPWGFAPFHYGRWANFNGTWGWIPAPPRASYGGAVYVRPVYAPALVAWVGVGGGGGGVAWFPLGPREVFAPSYPVSRNYWTNVNVSNTRVETTVVNNYYNTVVVNKTVNVTNITYVNQRVAGAVVATTPQAFSSGQPIAKNFVAVRPNEYATTQVTVLTPPTVPQREAVLGGRPAATVRPPAAVQARAVVAKTTPPPRPPAFAQRQAAIQANGGRPLSAAQVKQIPPPAHAQAQPLAQVKVAPPAKPAQMKPAPTKANAPANANANRPAEPNRPANPPPAPAPAANNKPAPPPPPAANNRPAAPVVAPPPAANVNNNRPPTARPQDEQLEQKHQQEAADLHKQQDEERQKLEQQQQAERQKQQQQAADAAKQKQLDAQHQQQLEQLQQKHQQEQQQLQQKQEQEHRDAEKKNPPPPAKPKPTNPQ
jgi:hypothetical protein